MNARSESIASPTSADCRMSSTPSDVVDDVVDERVDPRRARVAEDRDLLAREVVLGEEPVPHGVVDVVVDVRDAVDEPHDLPLERLRLTLAGVREDPVADLVGEVERARDRERLLVVAEAPAEALLHRGVERVLAGVPERRVPHVVAEPDRLDEVLVQPERPRDDARDRSRLERVGHARAVVVALGIDEDLRLPLQAPERLRVDDAVAIALELACGRRTAPPARSRPRVSSDRTANGDRLDLERPDPLLERRHQTMIGTVPPSALHAAPVTYEARSEQRKTIDRRDLLRAGEPPERAAGADLREHLVAVALLIREPTVAEPRVRPGRPGRDGVAADVVASRRGPPRAVTARARPPS